MFLVQHGWGKGERIRRAIDAGADGVILGLCDESKIDMSQVVSALSGQARTLMIDPQTYVLGIPDATRVKHLREYPFVTGPLRLTDFSARGTSRLVREVLGYQAGLPVTHIVAPGMIQRTFDDEWAQVNRNLALEAAEQWAESGDKRPLLSSLIVTDSAFNDREAMFDFLDDLTTVRASGFYVVLSHSSGTYTLNEDPDVLLNWMLLVNGLALNDFEVICGYTDLSGLLAKAAGATTFASGWSQSLRRFATSRWLPTTGGRAAHARYTSSQLLGHLVVDTELRAVSSRQQLHNLLGHSSLDERLRRHGVDGVNWTQETAHVQYLEACLELDRITEGSEDERIEAALAAIRKARTLLSRLQEGDVLLEPTWRHLESWESAVKKFAEVVRVSVAG